MEPYASSRFRFTTFYHGAAILTVFGLLVFAFFASLSYYSVKNYAQTALQQNGRMQGRSIDEWFRRAKDVSRQITSRSRMREELQRYNAREISATELRSFSEPKMVDAMALSPDILAIIRVARNGQPVAWSGVDPGTGFLQLVEFDRESLTVSAASLVDQTPCLAVTAPIVSRDGEHQGFDVVIFRTSGLGELLAAQGDEFAGRVAVLGYPEGDGLSFLTMDNSLITDHLPFFSEVRFKRVVIDQLQSGQNTLQELDGKTIFHLTLQEAPGWHVVIAQDQYTWHQLFWQRLKIIGGISVCLLVLAMGGLWFITRPLAGKLLLHADQLALEVDRKTADLNNEIARRRQIEKDLKASEARYRQIFATNLTVKLIIDPQDGRIVEANQAAVDFYGYDYETLTSRKISALNPIDSVQSRLDMSRIVEQKTSHFTLRHQLASGDIRYVEAYACTIDGENGPLIYSIIHDVTAQRQAEKARADSEQRIHDILELLPDATFGIDRQGTVILWNRAMEKMTGISKGEMLGKGDYAYAVPFYGTPRPVLIDLVMERDRDWENEYMNVVEHDGILFATEAYLPHLDGGRYVAATASRLYDRNGKVIGSIESIRDITDAKRLQQERERLIADLQRALGEVRTLSGLLPICSSCKKIRDDKGYWNQIENYIAEHTSADFSHSICPDCAARLYGDEAWFKDMKNDKKS